MTVYELKSIRINKDIHKKLKIFCSENELKINSVLEKIILDYIENNQIKNDNRWKSRNNCCKSNEKYYINLGYYVPNINLPRIEVYIKDLPKKSNIKVRTMCVCGKINTIPYSRYTNSLEKYGYCTCKGKCSSDKVKKTSLEIRYYTKRDFLGSYAYWHSDYTRFSLIIGYRFFKAGHK